jgi:hypothetical protein
MTEPLDITSEAERTYHYADGTTFTIEEPYKLHVTESGSHRVIAQNGRTYRPERGWVAISWLPRDGQPAFVA